MSFTSQEEAIQHAATRLQQAGLQIEFPKAATPNYSFVAKRAHDHVAVQLNWTDKKLGAPAVQAFSDYLSSRSGTKFREGFLLSAGGFANTALARVSAWGEEGKIRCFELREPKSWVDAQLADPFPKTTRIGIFAAKGGVGKTTVASHLSGALALHGCDIDLIDIDPQQNLKELVGEQVTVPTQFGVSTVDVFSIKDWKAKPGARRKAYVFDCSPVFSENPRDVMQKIDAFIIPITLNPAGLGRDGNVITRTVSEIRSANRSAKIFVVANDFNPALIESPRGQGLREIMMKSISSLPKPDANVFVFDPFQTSIRSSNLLRNWGVNSILSSNPTPVGLAFPLRGKTNRQLNDFMSLAEGVVEKMN